MNTLFDFCWHLLNAILRHQHENYAVSIFEIRMFYTLIALLIRDQKKSQEHFAFYWFLIKESILYYCCRVILIYSMHKKHSSIRWLKIEISIDLNERMNRERKRKKTKSWQRYFLVVRNCKNQNTKIEIQNAIKDKTFNFCFCFHHSVRTGNGKKLLLVTGYYMYAECYRFSQKPPIASIFQFNALSLCGVIMLSNNICTRSNRFRAMANLLEWIHFVFFIAGVFLIQFCHSKYGQPNQIESHSTIDNWRHDHWTEVHIFNSISNFNVLFQTDCYCFRSPNGIKVIFKVFNFLKRKHRLLVSVSRI